MPKEFNLSEHMQETFDQLQAQACAVLTRKYNSYSGSIKLVHLK